MRSKAIALVLVLGAAHIQSAAAVECTCRAKDVVASLGESVCISTPNGRKRAVCEKVLNNTAWRFLPGGCDVRMTQALQPLPPPKGAGALLQFGQMAQAPRVVVRPKSDH